MLSVQHTHAMRICGTWKRQFDRETQFKRALMPLNNEAKCERNVAVVHGPKWYKSTRTGYLINECVSQCVTLSWRTLMSHTWDDFWREHERETESVWEKESGKEWFDEESMSIKHKHMNLIRNVCRAASSSSGRRHRTTCLTSMLYYSHKCDNILCTNSRIFCNFLNCSWYDLISLFTFCNLTMAKATKLPHSSISIRIFSMFSSSLNAFKSNFNWV